MGKRFVITGGPCVGKSTIIESLANRDFHVIPEAARIIISEETSKKSDILPWLNMKAFNKKVFELQKEMESEIPKGKTTFLDRGIIDGFVYYAIKGLKVPETSVRYAKANRYDMIFLLDRLPFFKSDFTRREDPETAGKIQGLIEEYYRRFGYSPIKVPALPIRERMDFILDNI